MQLTVRELQKWLIELPGDFVVTLADEYISATNPDSDTYEAIWIGADEYISATNPDSDTYEAIWIGTDEVTELC